MAILLDGKKVSKKIQQELKEKLSYLHEKYNKIPGLTVVLVGSNPASQVYVNKKEKLSKEIGINSNIIKLPETTKENELIKIINELNNDSSVNGILVQLPLPKHIDFNKVLCSIDPKKDVDGLNPLNLGMLFAGLKPYAIPCTPYGIIKILEEYNIDFKGKNAVVIGRSNLVGKPIGMLLLAKHCTVTMCHSRTKDIGKICKEADIIVVAIGKEKFLQKEWVKPDSIIVDVGTNIDSQTGKLCGDVDFLQVEPVAGFITPVPGGIGLMTVTMLLSNTIKLFEDSLSELSK